MFQIRLFISAGICCFISFYSWPVLSDNQQKLKSVQERIQSLQKDIVNKEAIKHDTTIKLQETQRVIADIMNQLQKLTINEKAIHQELQQFQMRHNQLNNSIKKEQNQLEQLLYQQYIAKQHPHLQSVFSQNSLNQMLRDRYYYKQLLLAGSDSIQRLLNHQHEIATLSKKQQTKQQEIVAIQSQYSSQQEQLAQEKNKQQQLLTQVSSQITQQQDEINRLRSDEKRITQLISKLNEAIRLQELEKKREKASKEKELIQNNKRADASISNSSFNSSKRQFNLPVRGKLLNRFGDQRSGKHVTWKGLFIQSSNGSEVKAIADGKVVFADWLKGFGKLLIIDHGKGFMSLYGNNETLYKQVDTAIRAGDIVATVGNSSGSLDSGLYFELRYNGKPLDPLTRIKIE